jgi:PncC family amidohydrolase
VTNDFAHLVESEKVSVAVAESATGGALALAIVEIPGSGEWFRGGVVAYDTAIKRELLGVTAESVVSPAAAMEMASGVARLMHADLTIATTGCAGPEPMEGEPVGTLWVGISLGDACDARHHRLDGSPESLPEAFARIALAEATHLLGRRSLRS